ncbi:hypothetical protein SAICODRAFT_206770 [Saitoella complicata NRRL Y-17804]|uniref:uncharacterized protein n=1 Tax=Saitoella complicata (strain BCRC 22490 / CBS 7301 / JCM 7358 / NBRC 10748 / NRRL Y-17804) TaxID=698492 RepID=UPI000867CE2A|nr:uncharacterized protein SAICODRAFT_206770 [Saitoella complicata NRRL Y-17804]ODQ54848.1 hypothetical protein SAICODRAFT_206770 [Saitoella complicata NRRL Y-17804]
MSATSRSGDSPPRTSFEEIPAYPSTLSRELRLNLPSIRTLQLDTPLPGGVRQQASTSAPDMPWSSPLEFALPPLERARSSFDETASQSRTYFEQHPGMCALAERGRMDQSLYTSSDTLDAHLDVSTRGAARLPLTPESARFKDRYTYRNDLGYHVPARSVTALSISEVGASPQRTPPMSVHGSAVPRFPTPVVSGRLRHGPYPAPLSAPMSTRQMTEPIPPPLDGEASATSLKDAATLLFFKKEGVRHQRLIPRVRSLPHLKRELPGPEPHAVEAVRTQSRNSYTSSDDSSAYGTASQDDASDFRSPADLSSLLLNRRRRRRPPSTFGNYTNLIAHAILDSPNKRLTLKGLYVELPKRWPDLFNDGKGDKGWQVR